MTLRNPAVEVSAPVTIGHQGGRVVLVFGVDDPRPYLAWTPEQARRSVVRSSPPRLLTTRVVADDLRVRAGLMGAYTHDCAWQHGLHLPCGPDLGDRCTQSLLHRPTLP
jgi:hypothetical protein